jgi:hypothetical protein
MLIESDGNEKDSELEQYARIAGSSTMSELEVGKPQPMS